MAAQCEKANGNERRSSWEATDCNFDSCSIDTQFFLYLWVFSVEEGNKIIIIKKWIFFISVYWV